MLNILYASAERGLLDVEGFSRLMKAAEFRGGHGKTKVLNIDASCKSVVTSSTHRTPLF